MENLRKYGNGPFGLALVHGGPGAAGEMAPVARRLGRRWGVLEPLQTSTTLAGQVDELGFLIRQHAALPATLAGYSWGAWLAIMLAARSPSVVRKLILIGCGPLEPRYATGIEETRLERLSPEERREIDSLTSAIENASSPARREAFARFGEVYSKADTFDALPGEDETVEFSPDIYRAVWPEGAEMRRTGELLRLAGLIECPVVAIHGDYDPHPAEGVREPMSRVVKNFRLYILERCGHKPWIERHAADQFYRVLEREI